MIFRADVATGMVDSSADRMEHVLDQQMIDRLEEVSPAARAMTPSR